MSWPYDYCETTPLFCKAAQRPQEVPPKLGWLLLEMVQCTSKYTTQLVTEVADYYLFCHHYKLRTVQLNCWCLLQVFATDTFLPMAGITDIACAQSYLQAQSQSMEAYTEQSWNQRFLLSWRTSFMRQEQCMQLAAATARCSPVRLGWHTFQGTRLKTCT